MLFSTIVILDWFFSKRMEARISPEEHRLKYDVYEPWEYHKGCLTYIIDLSKFKEHWKDLKKSTKTKKRNDLFHQILKMI